VPRPFFMRQPAEPMQQSKRTATETRRMLTHEQTLWDCGYDLIAGVDEVGRGALAGPLVAAAVVLPCDAQVRRKSRGLLSQIRDSKTLTPLARARIAPAIGEFALGVAFGVVEADELDDIGLAAANRLAMERAVAALPIDVSALLIDATVLDLGLPQVGLIDGDALSLSVAAASIVAKVTRDGIMGEIHVVDGRYGFIRHKGYGTAEHLAALREFGPCWCHRRSYQPCSIEMAAD
jgi:ribonuclease HII